MSTVETMSSEVAIKKNFVEIIEFLKANEHKKVGSILDEVIAMTASKKRDSTVKYDEDGNPTEIFCWYHKEWEPVDWYGKKASSHSGYNTMCKEGVNQWTSQQAQAKKAKEQVLKDVQDEKIAPADIQEHLERIEAERQKIYPREQYLEAQRAKLEQKLKEQEKQELKQAS